MKSCRMSSFFYQILIFVLTIVVIESGEHLYAHGPFGKAHLTVNLPNPYNCNRTIGLFSRLIHSKSIQLIELKVSSTNYSNKDQIKVSWTPLSSTPCNDDFIGVYFIEVPLDNGKSIHSIQ